MTLSNCYVTLIELKARMGITDTVDDVVLEAVITAVCRHIDNYTHRRFYTTSSDETLYFTAESSSDLFPDTDILSVTSLATDDDGSRTYATTWAATDFDLMPSNSLPKLWIRTAPNGNYYFPRLTNGVKIVGKFGYSSTAPDPVREACLIQSNRIFLRKSAPFGVIGSNAAGEMFVINTFDPDVEQMLSHYRRLI